MIIAVTGASGFIGAAACRALHENGHKVVALVRPTSERAHTDPYVARYVSGDQADPAIWPELLEGVDGIVHNSMDWDALRSGNVSRHLRTNLLGAIELLEACRGRGVRRFVYISSVATQHDISPAWHGVIDEDHSLRPSTLYGACKAAVEPHLWWAHFSHGMHTVALRPCAVYGVEPVRLERSHGYKAVVRLLEGGRVTPEEFGGGGKFVHVDDVALAIVRSLERPEAAGRAFNLADCYAKHTRIAEHAAAALGLPRDRVSPDTSPPARNAFSRAAAQSVLGVALDRGDAGLAAYAAELVEAVRAKLGRGAAL